MNFNTVEYQIPIWAVCPLTYGDMSAIDDEDEAMVDAFTARMDAIGDGWHIEWPRDIDEAKYFSHTNAFCNMGSDVVLAKVHFPQVTA